MLLLAVFCFMVATYGIPCSCSQFLHLQSADCRSELLIDSLRVACEHSGHIPDRLSLTQHTLPCGITELLLYWADPKIRYLQDRLLHSQHTLPCGITELLLYWADLRIGIRPFTAPWACCVCHVCLAGLLDFVLRPREMQVQLVVFADGVSVKFCRNSTICGL